MTVDDQIIAATQAAGFAAVGFTSVEPLSRGEAALRTWLDDGCHGEMTYLTAPARSRPEELLAGARSIIAVALPHGAGPRLPAARGRGFVARYARGADYHIVIKAKLRDLAKELERITGNPVAARACTDTAPLLEHEVAARAGVGFIGKNTLTILPGSGSCILLGELLVDVELAPSTPMPPRCGECTACLEACPTGALEAPYRLDARACVAYLTIELRGPIPRSLRSRIGTRVFGCDDCQSTCPFNTESATGVPELVPHPDLVAPRLEDLLALTSSAYRRLVEGTALRRVTRHQLARNAAVALGNAGDRAATPTLVRALFAHPSPLVRGHAAWALGELGGAGAQAALEHPREELDPFVTGEIADARERGSQSL